MSNIECINSYTDIDAAFELLLKSSVENNVSQDEMPTTIIVVSDMEFDEGVYSKGGTNFSGWKKAFEKHNCKLPKIVFWNVAAVTYGVLACKYDNDVIMISGFSINVLESIAKIENYNPVSAMLEILIS